MNLKPAADYIKPISEAYQAGNPTPGLTPVIHQIQADALRWAVFQMAVNAADPSVAFTAIHNQANQLDPKP